MNIEELVSMLEADPSFTLGLGKGKGPVQTGRTSAESGKQFSSPGQGVWPGLVSISFYSLSDLFLSHRLCIMGY